MALPLLRLPRSLLADPEPFGDVAPVAPTAPGPRPVPDLGSVARRTRPTVLAGDRTLPVHPVLSGLLPDGLCRGTVVQVAGAPGAGSRSLVLVLLAEATAAGSWAGVVGDPDLGLAAAAEAGVALRRLALVDAPGPAAWGRVVGTLVGALDLVVVAPRHRVPAAQARRLAVRARERGTVVVQTGAERWPGPVDLRLTVSDGVWEGPGPDHGRLLARRVTVAATGRGAAARSRTATLLVPGPGGAPVSVGPNRPDQA